MKRNRIAKEEKRYWDGYPTNDGCDICGKKPAEAEPRFMYISCAEHSYLTPIEFSEIVYNKKKL